MDYLESLMKQENQAVYDSPENTVIQKNKAPEKDGGYDIAYGHKLTKDEEKDNKVYGIDISKGITKDEARNILAVDRLLHKDRARDKVGEEVWQELPEEGKDFLTDYSFTGTLDKFPKMVEALKNKDKEGVLKEYHRKFTDKDGELQVMGRRNQMAFELLQGAEEYFN